MNRRFLMRKIYIDVPVVGYETWLISSYIIDSKGDIQCCNDEPLEKLSHEYPYDERNKHIV